jgi:hypothetical protein
MWIFNSVSLNNQGTGSQSSGASSSSSGSQMQDTGKQPARPQEPQAAVRARSTDPELDPELDPGTIKFS